MIEYYKSKTEFNCGIDLQHFPTAKDFCSYSQLVKGSVASAGKVKGLCGGKMGNPYLRWAFGQAAVLCKRNHPLLTPYAEMLVSKRSPFDSL